jgi:hypothetical protein
MGPAHRYVLFFFFDWLQGNKELTHSRKLGAFMVEKIGHVRNPLTVIAIFAGIAEISGTVVLPLLEASIQNLYVWFLMLFPFFLVGTFFLVLYRKHGVLYAPSDYKEESNFFRKATDRELQLSTLEKAIQAEEPLDSAPAESKNPSAAQSAESKEPKLDVEPQASVSPTSESSAPDPLTASAPSRPYKEESAASDDAKVAQESAPYVISNPTLKADASMTPALQQASELVATQGKRLSEIGIGELWKHPFLTNLRHIENLAVNSVSKSLGIGFERNITLDLPGLETTVFTALGRVTNEVHIVEVRYAKDGRFDEPAIKSLLFDLNYARAKMLANNKPYTHLQVHLFLVADQFPLNSITAQSIFRFAKELDVKVIVHFTTVAQLEAAHLLSRY